MENRLSKPYIPCSEARVVRIYTVHVAQNSLATSYVLQTCMLKFKLLCLTDFREKNVKICFLIYQFDQGSKPPSASGPTLNPVKFYMDV